MNPSMAHTRIRLPECGGPRLERRALQDRLTAAGRVVVVQAPGGYGKTSLVVDALASAGVRAAWYSVLPDEADGHTFLACLLEAVRQEHPDVARRALATFAVPQAVPPLLVLNAFLNDLLESGETIHLVLDDLHLLAGDDGVRTLLQRLIEHAPPQLRLYLLTRQPLEVATARLEVAGAVQVLRAEDLAFRPEEVEAVFRDIWGVPVHPAAVGRLMELSDGWIAALVLVRLAARDQGLDQVLGSFDAGSRPVFDYLGEEILRREPPEVQHFLRETSILQGFDAETAAALSGQEEAARLLADLERRGLFLVRGDRGTFRYHHLFEGFLREVLKREAGLDGWRARHDRAAAWFADRDAGLSISHALEAGEAERAADLLERTGDGWILRGATRRLGGWLSALPSELLERRPRLRVLQAAVDELRGEWVRAMRGFQDAIRDLGDDRQGLSDALERAASCLARYANWKVMGEFLRLAARNCPADDPGLRARILSWSGAHLLTRGLGFERGYRRAAASRRLARQSGSPEAIAVSCYTHAFFVHLARGRFERGLHLLQEGSHLMERLQNPFAALQMRMQQVVLLWLLGDLEEAWRRNLELERSMSDFERTFAAHAVQLNRATISLDAGRLDDCAAALQVLERDEVPMQIRPWYLRTVLLFELRCGRPDRAREASRRMREALREVGLRGVYAPECLLAAAAARESAGDPAGARRLARRALALAGEGRMAFWEMKAHAWLARLEGSDEHLAEALRRGREHGYERWWVNDGEGIATRLLLRAAAAGIEVEAATLLLRRQGPRASEFLASADFTPQERATAHRLLRPPEDPAQRVQICTLGGFAVLVDGRETDSPAWRRGKMVQLLKLLLSRPRLALTVEEAAERLWPQAAPARARHNVRVHVAHLRKALQPGRRAGPGSCLVFERDAYRLVPGEDLAVDRLRFEDLVREGERLARQGRGQEASRLLAEAAALYEGDFLAGEACEEWVEARRQALRELNRQALLRLAQVDRRRALTWLRRLQAFDPCDEEASRRLMEEAAALGEADEVRRAWSRLVEALRSELDAEPSPETAALARHLGAGPPTG